MPTTLISKQPQIQQKNTDQMPSPRTRECHSQVIVFTAQHGGEQFNCTQVALAALAE